MNKRKIIVTLIGVAILVVSFLASGMLKRAQPDLRPKPGEIATAVSTLPIAPGEVGRTLKVTGRLVPQSSVDLFAEVGGLAEFGDRPFKPGVRFEKGQVLLRINAAELESNLAASRSGFQSQLAGVIPDLKIDFPDEADAWKTYLEEMRVERTLAPLPDVDSQKLRLFLTGRNIYTTYYNIKEAETRREKHILRAPFSGSVTAASIDDAELECVEIEWAGQRLRLRPDEARPDVAEVFGDPRLEQSGFTCTLPWPADAESAYLVVSAISRRSERGLVFAGEVFDQAPAN